MYGYLTGFSNEGLLSFFSYFMPLRQHEPAGWLSTIRLQKKEEKGRVYFYLQSSFLAWMVSLPFSCGGGGGGGGAVGGGGASAI
jgi:uncharacterized membrane protein YgcG